MHTTLLFDDQILTSIGGSLENGDNGFSAGKGISNPSNTPPAMRGYFTCRMDDKLFFGFGWNGRIRTDNLWSYSFINKMYIWEAGSGLSSSAFPVYINSSFDATWGGRMLPGGFCTDNQIYVFGGSFPDLSVTNSLFKFDLFQGDFEYVKGGPEVAAGSYGVRGVESPSNNPIARLGHNYFFDSTTDSFFVFGGAFMSDAIFSQPYGDRFSDMWKYNITSNNWVWMHGPNEPNRNGVYGTPLVSALTNVPGARSIAAQYYDDVNSKFYIFGGLGFSQADYGNLNDLWHYDVATNEWVFHNGEFLSESFGSFGEKYVASPNNNPRSRTGASMWIDFETQKLYLFAGTRIYTDESGELFYSEPMSDLWRYSIESNIWTWIGGPKEPLIGANYNEQGIEDPTNYPGAIWQVTVYFDQSLKTAWVFGGGKFGAGVSNEIWSFKDNGDPPIVTTTISDTGNPSTVSLSTTRSTTEGMASTTEEFLSRSRNFNRFQQEAPEAGIPLFAIIAIVVVLCLAVVGTFLFVLRRSGEQARMQKRQFMMAQQAQSQGASYYAPDAPYDGNAGPRSLSEAYHTSTTRATGAPRSLSDAYHTAGANSATAMSKQPMARQNYTANGDYQQQPQQPQQPRPQQQMPQPNKVPVTQAAHDEYGAAPAPTPSAPRNEPAIDYPRPAVVPVTSQIPANVIENPAMLVPRAEAEKPTVVQHEEVQQEAEEQINRPDLPDYLEVRRSDFDMQQQLGSQNGNMLHLAVALKDGLRLKGDKVVVKVYGENTYGMNPGFETMFWQEVGLLWKFNEHKNISQVSH